MNFNLFSTNPLAPYTKYELKTRMNSLETMLNNKNTLSTDDIDYYKTMLNALQTATTKVTESQELCHPIMAKTILKLNFFVDINAWLHDNGAGAAWISGIRPSHEASLTNHKDFKNGKLYGVYESPFAERERHIEWNKGSWLGVSKETNPLQNYPVSDLEKNYKEHLEHIQCKQDKIPPDCDAYYRGLLSAIEQGMLPLKSQSVFYFKALPKILTLLTQVPELHDSLSKCRVASIVMFEKYSETLAQQPIQLPAQQSSGDEKPQEVLSSLPQHIFSPALPSPRKRPPLAKPIALDDELFLRTDQPSVSRKKLQTLDQNLELLIKACHKESLASLAEIHELVKHILDDTSALKEPKNSDEEILPNGLAQQQFEELTKKLDAVLKQTTPPEMDHSQKIDQVRVELTNTLNSIKKDIQSTIADLQQKDEDNISNTLTKKDETIKELQSQKERLAEQLGESNFAKQVLDELKKEGLNLGQKIEELQSQKLVLTERLGEANLAKQVLDQLEKSNANEIKEAILAKDKKIEELEQTNKNLLEQLGEQKLAEKVLAELKRKPTPVPRATVSHWITSPAWILAIALAGVIGFQMAKKQNR